MKDGQRVRVKTFKEETFGRVEGTVATASGLYLVNYENKESWPWYDRFAWHGKETLEAVSEDEEK